MISVQTDMSLRSVSVIGLGYIGLPTAAILASRKIKVIGVDISKQTVEIINQGKIHIVEPELDILVHAAVTAGFLRATLIPESTDAYIIAVPTPFKDNHEPDLSYIQSASLAIAPVLKKGDLIILESTSPVGTTEKIAAWLAESRWDLTFPHTHGECSDIRLAYCPERVLPGHILRELVQNDRVIGGITPKCSEMATELYKTFVEGDCIVTHARTAEMCKLTENSFRDVNIAFANELSLICDQFDINVWELIKLANRHPRVNILQPGPGVGGHCIAVDPWFLVSQAPNQSHLIRTAREVNDSKPAWVIDKLKSAISQFLRENADKKATDVTIACLGLSFKADIDDLRESPALEITKEVLRIHSGHVLIVEPNINTLPLGLMGNAQLSTIEQALAEADIILFLVNHKAFRELSKNHFIEYRVVDASGCLEF